MSTNIGVIGAGAAAVGFLDALSRTDGPPATVTVFEPSPHLWRGRAYQPDLDAVRVNAPPVIMSARHGDPEHYARWLGDRAADHLDTRFGQPIVPRALYGSYLEDTAEAALKALRAAGWRTRIVRARVTGLSGNALTTDDGEQHAIDRAALCIGGGTPRDHYGLGGAPGFVRDPYPLASTLDQIGLDRDVAIVGSGLTAVDIAVSLAARGHQGHIAFLSREGVLPAVWQRPFRFEPRHLDTIGDEPVTLDGLRALLDAELADLGQDLSELTSEIAAVRDEDPIARLRRQLAQTDAPGLGRRVLQQAAHTLGPRAWRLLPAHERDLLRGTYFRAVASLASPMVPGNAATLLDLFDSGQATMVAGVQKIEPGFRITADRDTTADVVVNAVNPPPHSIPQGAEPLVSALLDAGASLHDSGGLVTGPDHPIIGDLAGGGFFLTTSIPGLAARGHTVATSLRGSST
ncbi:FAD/NAD(P)-binding protein [Spirillospora sp. CA-294931]|uniref:FAD/NAD(P)-binding protein n=1 Tax=Spirillospora sp. CA-294931 TaxID=3240042 RepID=UPI003D94E9A4